MLRRQAYVFELMPDGARARSLRRFAGCARFVYNRALALQQERHQAGEKKLSYSGLCAQLTSWRTDPATAWLGEAHSQVLQQAAKDLERAYANFFAGRAALPKFHKKGVNDSFRFPQGVKLDQPNTRVWLPKIGWMRYRASRQVLGAIKNTTVRCTGGKWLVSVQTERNVAEPAHPASTSIGIDLGVARLATLSDGAVVAPLDPGKRHARRLARAQRALSRKVKFSSNWKKARGCVQRIQRDIGNARRDYLHKATTAISQNHALVIVEDLQVGNMSRSARGSAEAPGKNVRAKAGLNRAILDQGWGEFRRQLQYKQAWRGGWLIAVPPQHTSQTCPACGHVHADNRQTQARFACVACGHTEHADLVAARNIRTRGLELMAAGHAVSACGGSAQQGAPAKQEPTEAAAREPAHA
jgi:putative transposase